MSTAAGAAIGIEEQLEEQGRAWALLPGRTLAELGASLVSGVAGVVAAPATLVKIAAQWRRIALAERMAAVAVPVQTHSISEGPVQANAEALEQEEKPRAEAAEAAERCEPRPP